MTTTHATPVEGELAEFWAGTLRGGLVRRLFELARDEDLGAAGDVTSACSIDPGVRGNARIVARSGGVVCGLAAGPELLPLFAPGCEITWHARDGERVGAGTTLATLRGGLYNGLRGLLALERTWLNLLGRLSGVATRTAQFVAALPPGCRAKVYDTRKTTPGLRVLEKYAVRCGGGRSHRMGLHDAVLLKDNHLAGVGVERLAGFVAGAAERARAAHPGLLFVQVEVDTLEQFEALLTLPAGVIDIVLLDNMTVEQMRRACVLRDGANKVLELEASGGVTLATVAGIASTGVDRISIGGLTHQAVSIDVAMDVEA